MAKSAMFGGNPTFIINLDTIVELCCYGNDFHQ